MSIIVDGNKVTVEDDELDPFTSGELRSALAGLAGDNVEDVILDLASVESFSSAGLQVLLSAKRSFKNIEFTNMQDSLKDSLASLRIDI